ncbi:MAG: hypothetical protein V4812_13400 [Pseudomonadota bacterium]
MRASDTRGGLLGLPLPPQAVLELAFPLEVAAIIGHTLWEVRQTRHYPVDAVLLLLALAAGLSIAAMA